MKMTLLPSDKSDKWTVLSYDLVAKEATALKRIPIPDTKRQEDFERYRWDISDAEPKKRPFIKVVLFQTFDEPQQSLTQWLVKPHLIS